MSSDEAVAEAIAASSPDAPILKIRARAADSILGSVSFETAGQDSGRPSPFLFERLLSFVPRAAFVAGLVGFAGVAGAMSMAAGEYVSVSSQSDTERADRDRERKELRDNPEFELDELTEIYLKRGVDQSLARQVAQQLMRKDALTAHARDELGISEITPARPVQAALTSATMFSLGAAMPLLMVVVSPTGNFVPIVSAASLGFLALLGAIGARAGGANVLRATARVTFWGAFAMALTAGIGKIFGTVV